MERNDLVDLDRLSTNRSTERYQPHHGAGRLKEQPTETWGHHGPFSTITRGPTGVGATFAMMEPIGHNWHEVEGAAVPLVQRGTGA